MMLEFKLLPIAEMQVLFTLSPAVSSQKYPLGFARQRIDRTPESIETWVCGNPLISYASPFSLRN